MTRQQYHLNEMRVSATTHNPVTDGKTSIQQTKKQYHYYKSQLLFAMSPLIALFYVIYTGFEPEEVEQKKRAQKGDFQLDGHSE